MSWLRRLFGSSSEEEQEEWTAKEDSAPSLDWQTPPPYPPFSETQQDPAPSSDRQTPPPYPPPPTSHDVPTAPLPPLSKKEQEVLQMIQRAARDRVTTLDLSGGWEKKNKLENLPAQIGQLTHLTTLDLSRNRLSSLPAEIGQLTNLKQLDLRYNPLPIPTEILKRTNEPATILNYYLHGDPKALQIIKQALKDRVTELDLSNQNIAKLPSEIGQLTNLITLNLGNNELSSLPPEIGQLTNLSTLNLHNNPLRELPPEIGQLTNLTTLDLSNSWNWEKTNRLSSLPAEIGQLTNLTTLDLSGSQSLRSLPPEIGQLTNLTTLIIHSTNFKELPAQIGKLLNLQYLDLRCTSLSTLPPEIGQLSNLTELYLARRTLSVFPPEIGQLTNLTKLCFSGETGNSVPTGILLKDAESSSLRTLPPEIGKLTNLEELNLCYNQLSSLPAEIGQLTNLTTLDLWGNKLSSLPAEIGQLTNLTELNLQENLLSTLPPEIGQLTNLTRLDLSGYWHKRNQLSSLPAEIGQLTNLISLSLWNNQLSALPPEITQLTNLKKLDLRNNPLPIPPEILERTDEPATILNYYFRGQKTPLNEAKLVFVGEGRVGKTSLVRRLVEGLFDPNEAITEGIAIKGWKVGGGEGEVKLNIWDFGGQEIMHGTHQFFLTLRSLYVLVLDVQEDEAGNRLDYWLKMIESFGADSPIIVVINQIDQPRKLYLNRGELRRNYPNIKAFVETSCQSGEGMANLEERITSQIGSLAHVRDEIPIEWLAVKRQLEGLGKDYVAVDDYIALCQANHVREEKEQGVLLSLLHELGVVLHFEDDPRLSEMNVLNPFWATGGVYQIIHAKSSLKRQGISELGELEQGILSVGQLDHILDQEEYPREKHLFILLMMRKFELCFDLAGHTGEKFLIPDLLPPTQPKFSWGVDCLNFEYHYDFLPRSVMSRFIVRMHDFIFKDMAWRNGVRLVNNTNQALVKALPRSKRIVISLSGERQGRLEFWHKIRAGFDEIHQSIKGLNATLKIPVYKPPLCPDCNALNRIGAKYCRQCGHSIPVASHKEPHCQDCGGQNRPRANFCNRCGLALVTYTPPLATVDYRFLRNLQQKGIEQHHVPVGDDVVVVNVRELLEGVKPAPKVVESPEVAALENLLERLSPQVHPQRFYKTALSLGELYYEDMSHYTGARYALEKGHEAIEALRGMVQEAIQVQLSADSVRLYEMLVRSYLVEGDEEKAFEYAAAAKGRAFVNRLALARLDLKKIAAEKPEFASQLALARAKRQEIDELEQQIGVKGANRNELRGKQNVLLGEERELWRDMARDYPALTATLSVPSLSLEDARALAKELDATLVEYYRHTDGWCAFVVTAEGVQHVDLPALNQKLLDKLVEWRNNVHKEPGRSVYRLRRLADFYTAAVAPLKLGSTQVIFAPFRELHLLPLAIARHPVSKDYLIDEHLVSYIPSLTALYVVSQEQKRHQKAPPSVQRDSWVQPFERLLSVAYPGTPPLPNVLAEAQAIEKRLSGIAEVETLYEEAATPLNVLQKAPNVDVIHFGCHGNFDEHDPTQSGLELASEPLTVSQIITITLKRTRLATLAACLTGQVALREGEEHIGLLQAMMTAGVRTVVASLWPVNDAATRALFEAFYMRFAQGYAPQEAMQDACRLLRQASDWQHPFFWASFIVNGLVEPGKGREEAWPTELVAQINIYQRQSTQQRGEIMTDQRIAENAELLLHDLLCEREEVLAAFQKYPLSPEVAKRKVSNDLQGHASALYLIVQDNPALQDFLPPPTEMGEVRISYKQYQQAKSQMSSAQSSPQVVENSVSDYQNRLRKLLQKKNPPTNPSLQQLEIRSA